MFPEKCLEDILQNTNFGYHLVMGLQFTFILVFMQIDR